MVSPLPSKEHVNSHKQKSYVISGSGLYKSIRCRLCNLRSYNKWDVEYRYCSRCKLFHDDDKAPEDVQDQAPPVTY